MYSSTPHFTTHTHQRQLKRLSPVTTIVLINSAFGIVLALVVLIQLSFVSWSLAIGIGLGGFALGLALSAFFAARFVEQPLWELLAWSQLIGIISVGVSLFGLF